METLKRFLVTLLQPGRAGHQVQTALPLTPVPDLHLIIIEEKPPGLPGTPYPLHEATLFMKLPDLARLTPDQMLVWQDVLRWELEVLSQAYQALDPELESLDWINEPAD